MLKRLDRNYSQQEGEATSPAPEAEAAHASEQHFHSREYEKELRELEKELHARAEALGNTKQISEAAALREQAKKQQLDSATDSQTMEFVTLVDFIKKEHERNQQMKEPSQKAKILKLKNYEKVKDKEFEKKEKQKGLQLNTAA